jgi:hypothetical protein
VAGTSLRVVAAENGSSARVLIDDGGLIDPPDREHRFDNQVAGASVANRCRR